MGQYPIKEEFRPYIRFTPPIENPRMVAAMGEKMRPPGWLWRDGEIDVRREVIPGCGGDPIEVLCICPKSNVVVKECLLYHHGGGFFFGGAPYHYRLAKAYALQIPCKVIFVQYRLAPKHPFPIPVEDSYCALLWAHERHRELGIDPQRLAVGGDSAGGGLAAAVCQMSRDRRGPDIWFQLLVYPFTDRRLDSESNRRFTDTPVWNSKLSRIMVDAYLPNPDRPDIAYASPLEAGCFAGLPPAYIETAEFDCLHDDGAAYALALSQAGIPVELCQTRGTMHGFDLAEKAPTTRQAVARRVAYMRRAWERDKTGSGW